ncbi:hypothetical protein [Paenibacillus shenyangensis]|uniref:hypothetical protein n=1 Tax=Paenibacillus sp. A9 TaxID=1284352 RepID=UPI000360D99F|nr:hypothetical protein [Paenibacillus sp. A9]
MMIISVFAIVSFIAWIHATTLRLKRKNSKYDKYVFFTGVLSFLFLNIIQSQTFEYKTAYNLFFIAYSAFAVPFHIKLIVNNLNNKKTKKV